MSQNTNAHERTIQDGAKPSSRLGALILAAGLAFYLLVLAVGLTEAGIRADVAAKAISVLTVLSMLFPLAALVLFAMEFVEGTLIGTPVAWYAYTLSVLKQRWMAVVGGALLVIALLAILAAGSV